MGCFRCQLQGGLDELAVPAMVYLSGLETAAYLRYGRTPPPGIRVRMVIDSGSRYCSLTPALLQQLQPGVTGHFHVQTTIGEQTSEQFRVQLAFPQAGLRTVDNLKVASLPMPQTYRGEYQGIIGRNLLRHWYFYHAGPLRRFTIRDRPSLWTWLCS